MLGRELELFLLQNLQAVKAPGPAAACNGSVIQRRSNSRIRRRHGFRSSIRPPRAHRANRQTPTMTAESLHRSRPYPLAERSAKS
jgi:hypothetical protein